MAQSTYDFIALGALVTRLDPGIVPFEYADHYDLHVSGGEFNVAANMARAFGKKRRSSRPWSTTRSERRSRLR